MTTFQMIIVGLGALIGGSVLWEQIKGLLLKISKKVKEVKEVRKPDDYLVKNDHSDICSTDSLCSVVSCWEDLRDQLANRGLSDAVKELDKIFPLFIPAKEPVNTVIGPSSVGVHNE